MSFDSRPTPGPLVSGPALMVALLVSAALAWMIGGLAFGDAAEAMSTEQAAIAAYVAEDYEAAAVAGLRRLELPVVPADIDFRAAIADALVRTGREPEGLRLSEEVLAEGIARWGEDALLVAILRNGLAWNLVSLRAPSPEDLDRAETVVRRALVIASDNPYLLGTLATVHLRQGRLAEARDGFGRAISLHAEDRDRATDRALLAVTLAKLGQLDDAKLALGQARTDGQPDARFVEEAERLLTD